MATLAIQCTRDHNAHSAIRHLTHKLNKNKRDQDNDQDTNINMLKKATTLVTVLALAANTLAFSAGCDSACQKCVKSCYIRAQQCRLMCCRRECDGACDVTCTLDVNSCSYDCGNHRRLTVDEFVGMFPVNQTAV